MKSTDQLVELAHRQSGVDAFDSESFREGLDVFVRSVGACDQITPAGHERLDQMAIDHLVRRLTIDEYLRAHPEVLQAPVERPVFVMGMPRTGTTAVVNLLGQDPARRTVLRWTLEEPVPPPTTAGLRTDPRCVAALARQQKLIDDGLPGANIRFEWADSPAECVHVMNHDVKAMQWDSQGPFPEYREFIFSCDMTSAYQWHRRFLQLQQSQAPGTWALKAPSHALWVETLLTVYPDARIVWTHRDPYTALASYLSLAANAHRRNMPAADTDWLRTGGPSYVAEHCSRPMALLDARPELADRIHHVQYADFMRDEIGAMRGVYDWLGDDFTPEVEAAMSGWLGVRRQAQLGEHKYSLADFDLTQAQLRPLFEEYVERYDVPVKAAAS